LETLGSREKISLMFLPIIETIDKNNMIFMDAMDYINTSQLEIDKNRTKFHKSIFKQHFKYLKERDKKTYKMNKSIVNVISNFNFAMCHVFIRDQLQMFLLINIFKSSSNDLALLKN
jgi:hypothetical protein